jgi:hypothetical protein
VDAGSTEFLGPVLAKNGLRRGGDLRQALAGELARLAGSLLVDLRLAVASGRPKVSLWL